MRKVTPEIEQKIITCYNLNKSSVKTAQKFKLSKQTVLDVLIKNDIPRRSGLKQEGRNWKGYKDMPYLYFGQLKRSAKKRGIEFRIKIEDIWDRLEKQGRKCALTGLSLLLNSNGRLYDGNASLDRIDSTKGYTVDNIQWVHKRINQMKMDMTEVEFLEFCRLVVEFSE